MTFTMYFPENLASLKISVVHIAVLVIILLLIFSLFGFTQYKLLKTRRTPE